MNELLDRLVALRSSAKAGILAGALVLVVGGYYYFFYADLVSQAEATEKSIQRAEEERTEYKRRRQDYQTILLEVEQLRDEDRKLRVALPKQGGSGDSSQQFDIEQFIENVNSQVELAGLSKVTSVRETAVPEETFLRIPIRMSVTGTYHQINRFFSKVGELERIVTIADLQLSPAGDTKSGATLLKADFAAQIYQLVEKPGGAK